MTRLQQAEELLSETSRAEKAKVLLWLAGEAARRSSATSVRTRKLIQEGQLNIQQLGVLAIALSAKALVAVYYRESQQACPAE
jgi:hypothetical protein